MSVKYRARVRACLPAGRIGLAVALAAFLAACTTPAPFSQQPDPSDAAARVPGTGYRAVAGDYTSRRPVGPADWRGTNDSVAPKKGAH
jgi:hypothetical protein